MLKLCRIDSRLSHGKTVENWTREYGLDAVIIANDKKADDDFGQEIMNLSIPEGIDKVYLKIDELKDFLRAKDKDYLCLVESATDLEKILDQDIEIGHVNIGIIHMTKGKKSLTEEVAVDENDLRIFKKVLAKGIDLAIRLNPYATKKKLDDYLMEK